MILHRLIHNTHLASDSLLILMHGYGSDEQDMYYLAQHLAPDIKAICPRGPYEVAGAGFGWFDINWGPTEIGFDPEQALATVRDLCVWLEQMMEEHSPSKVVLGGFSQGGIMALGATLSIPEHVSACLVMSGMLIETLVPSTLPEALDDVRFLVQHGLDDQVLPISCGRELNSFLQNAGADLKYIEYPMGHEVSRESLLDAQQWLEQVTKG